jgi:Lrp/AsnC family leucine-responsive transcriptional regulator
MINEKDKEILKILQEDARISNAEIARKLGLAPSGIHERMKKLEQKGVIQSYEARIDPKAVELGLLSFIFIKTNGGVADWETGEMLAAIDEVLEVHCIAGEDCYLIKVRTKDAQALTDLLRVSIGPIQTITSTNSAIVLSTLKETQDLPLE